MAILHAKPFKRCPLIRPNVRKEKITGKRFEHPQGLDRNTKLNHKFQNLRVTALPWGWLVMADLQFRGYIPGAIGRIAEMHATYYHRHWGFGLFFEAKVAADLSEFLSRFDEAHDGFWTVCLENRVEGSVAIDGIKAASEGAHLRWFIVSPALHGKGFGHQLLKEAVTFCKRMRYNRVYLWTFEGLDAARHLYEKFGFHIEEEYEGTQWGTKVNEQKFVLNL
jgi:GNAT superfamily N-acetyltransferase